MLMRSLVFNLDRDDLDDRLVFVGGVLADQAVRDAYEVLRAVRPDLNETAMQAILGIVKAESDFGVRGSFLNADGTPSHNWGGRKGEGDAGCIMHGDADEVGKVCFSRFSTAEKGALGFFHTRAWGTQPFAQATLVAARSGSAYALAQAMYRGGYYTGFKCDGKQALPASHRDPRDVECAQIYYARFIAGAAASVARALGQKLHVRSDAPPVPAAASGWSTAGYVAMGAVVGTAWWLLRGSGMLHSRFIGG